MGSRVTIPLIAALWFAPVAGASEADWQRLPGAEMVPTDWGDGDSFLVRVSDPATGSPVEHVIRLYAIDCIETNLTRESDRRRTREQSNYFGVEDATAVLAYGQQAKELVETELQQPFTLFTVFALAEGRSGNPRYYAYITTASGRDLGALLVAQGLARSYGIARKTPGGTAAADYTAWLDDLELKAAMNRTGIWNRSDPDHLVNLREREREERRELDRLTANSLDSKSASPRPVAINRATFNELRTLPGVGDVLADRILDAREKKPFSTVDELATRVRGIGEANLEKMRPFIELGE